MALKPWVSFVVALLVVLNWSARQSIAQPVTAVPHTVSCPACRVVTEKLFTIASTDQYDLAQNAQPVRDSRGRYFALGFGGRSILVWDSTGKYITKFGAAGQGPGEFNGNILEIAIGRNDSILVADRTRLLSVFSSDLRFVRSVRIALATVHLTQLPNNQFLIMLPGGTPALNQRHPFHIVDGASGAVLRSFGNEGDSTPLSRMTPYTAPLIVASNDGRALWKWTRGQYRLERRSADGSRGEILDLSSAAWYRQPPPPEPPRERPREEVNAAMAARMSPSQAVRDSFWAANAPDLSRPVLWSSIELAGVDRSGRLWVIGTEPSPTSRTEDLRRMIEVIDPTTRSKLLSSRIGESLKLIPGTDLAYTRTFDSDGAVTITIWRVRIQEG